MKKFYSIAIGAIILGSGFFGVVSYATPAYAQAGQYDCKVTKASFDPGLNLDTSTFDAPTENRYFYLENNKPVITITITTENCTNLPVYVSIVDKGGFASAGGVLTGDFVPEMSFKKYIVPEGNQFTITAIAGETRCDSGNSPDCQYYVYVSPDTGLTSSNAYFSRDHTGTANSKGFLGYDCHTLCDDSWVYMSDTSLEGQKNSVLLSQGTSTVDPNSACYDKAAGKPIAGCYEIYDGLSQILEKTGQKFSVITDAGSLGEFVNAIIIVVIGITGVIVVVVIMYQGYRYIAGRKEGVPGKVQSAKTRIFQATLGLVLLLVMYTLLRTINPDLLILIPRIDMAQLDNGEEGDGTEDDAVGGSAAVVGDAPKSCPAGLETVGVFVVCKTISSKFKDMIAAASSEGITLGGGGYRSLTAQVNLRIRNCGGNSDYNVYQKPARQCVPPTAQPGKSRHQAGLAFDFTCNGIGIINTTKRPGTAVCYNWLKANAARFGFKNLPSENWHWSIDGK